MLTCQDCTSEAFLSDMPGTDTAGSSGPPSRACIVFKWSIGHWLKGDPKAMQPPPPFFFFALVQCGYLQLHVVGESPWKLEAISLEVSWNQVALESQSHVSAY